MTGETLGFHVVCPSVSQSVCPSMTLMDTTYHVCIAMLTWCRCVPPVLLWRWHAHNLLPRSCLTMGTTLRAAPSKSCAILTTYHVCTAMPTWCRCAPSISFWPWPPFTVFPMSCLTSIFFVDPHWWVPVPASSMYTNTLHLKFADAGYLCYDTIWEHKEPRTDTGHKLWRFLLSTPYTCTAMPCLFKQNTE